MADKEYNDFNDYTTKQDAKPSEQPRPNYQQPIYQQPDQQNIYSQPTESAEQSAAKTLGALSNILGLAGCCFIPLTAIGLVLGIIGVKKDKNSVISIVGIVLCAMMLLIWVFSLVMIVTDPEMRQAYQEYTDMLSQSFMQ